MSKFYKVMQAHYLPPSRAEVKDEWSYASFPPSYPSWHKQGRLPLMQAHDCSMVANTRHEKESSLEFRSLLKCGIRRCYNVRVILVYIVSRILRPPC
jgi:hypothetical protein